RHPLRLAPSRRDRGALRPRERDVCRRSGGNRRHPLGLPPSAPSLYPAIAGLRPGTRRRAFAPATDHSGRAARPGEPAFRLRLRRSLPFGLRALPQIAARFLFTGLRTGRALLPLPRGRPLGERIMSALLEVRDLEVR